MKEFENFIVEADDDSTQPDAKRNIINLITSNFYRFINSDSEDDNKSLLMLVAALAVLNTSDDLTALQASRRLAQMALSRAGRRKG